MKTEVIFKNLYEARKFAADHFGFEGSLSKQRLWNLESIDTALEYNNTKYIGNNMTDIVNIQELRVRLIELTLEVYKTTNGRFTFDGILEKLTEYVFNDRHK